MIQEITEHPCVREVKRIDDDPETHAVAVRSNGVFSDPSMGNQKAVEVPEEVLELATGSDGWRMKKLQFRTDGDYTGCFTFRLERL